MINFSKVFFNITTGSSSEERPQEAYSQQLQNLKRVWNEDSYGLERIARLFLCLSQFLFPVLLIRDVFGRRGAAERKLAVEAYTVVKFLLPLIVLGMGWYRYPWVTIAVAYFLTETIIHLLHLVFLSDVHTLAISYRRSLLLLFFHYAEVVFDFAVFYMAFNVLSRPGDMATALYFSLVTMTTVGFGDVYAANSAGQMIVMSELVVAVVFIVVFINHFSKN
jgi:hypothetical protein